jgi:hypothetical protein
MGPSMRIIGAVTVAAGLGVGALGALEGASAAPARPDSGVRGLVRYGPTCPVQRPGRNCERPYRATIVVRREPSSRLVTRAHSGADGRFTVRLRAGRYELEPTNGVPFPRASAQTITVEAHHFTQVTINFDSGIR